MKTHDSRCFDLAWHFLQGEEYSHEMQSDLAQRIQDAVEDWFAELEAKKLRAAREAKP